MGGASLTKAPAMTVADVPHRAKSSNDPEPFSTRMTSIGMLPWKR